MPWEPQLTVVAFRFRPARGDAEEATRRLLDHINASRRVFLSSTLIGGSFVIRACIVSHRTHRDRIEEATKDLRTSLLKIGPEPLFVTTAAILDPGEGDQQGVGG